MAGPWTPLGGVLTSDPTSVANGARTDVFARGGDNGIYQKTWSGTSWGPWHGLGGGFAASSGPDADHRAAGSVDIFARGTDNGLWHTWSDDNGDTFAAWESLAAGQTLTSDPAADSWAGGTHLDVYARGTDNSLLHRWWDLGSGWSNWESLGGVLSSSPGATSCANGHIDVFVLGADGGVWRKGYNGTSWSDWTWLGGSWTSAPAGVCRAGTNTIDVFARGTDNALWLTNTVTGS